MTMMNVISTEMCSTTTWTRKSEITLEDLRHLSSFSAADFSAFSKASIAFQFFSRNSCVRHKKLNKQQIKNIFTYKRHIENEGKKDV